MSERKVLGWAVWCGTGHPWLVDAHTHHWSVKENRCIFSSKEDAVKAMRSERRHFGPPFLWFKLYRIVSRPEAPKPDKLEQAIAKIQERLTKATQIMDDCIGRKWWGSAQAYESQAESFKLCIEDMEALR